MTQILKTNERTFNKKVKSIIVDQILLPSQKVTKIEKKHVPGIGYVWYLKNQYGVSLVNVHRDVQGMTIRYNR